MCIGKNNQHIQPRTSGILLIRIRRKLIRKNCWLTILGTSVKYDRNGKMALEGHWGLENTGQRHLAGLVERPWNPWSQGPEFEHHCFIRDYLKKRERKYWPKEIAKVDTHYKQTSRISRILVSFQAFPAQVANIPSTQDQTMRKQ